MDLLQRRDWARRQLVLAGAAAGLALAAAALLAAQLCGWRRWWSLPAPARDAPEAPPEGGAARGGAGRVGTGRGGEGGARTPPSSPARAGSAAAAPSARAGSAAAAPPAAAAASEVARGQVVHWAAGLRRADAARLPELLAWVGRLLEEPSPSDDGALAACLSAVPQVLAPGNELAGRAVELASRACDREPAKSLDVLNVVFKDPRWRGEHAAPAVVELAVRELRRAVGELPGQRAAAQRSARLLHFLAEESRSRALVASGGGPELVFEVLDQHGGDPGVALGCVGCLLCLAAEGLDLQKAVGAALGCMRQHPTNGDLQWRSLAALHSLPRHWEASDAAVVAAELACAAGTRHPHFDSVVEWVAKVLCRLVLRRDNGVRELLRRGAPDGWLRGFRENSYKIRKPNKEADHAVAELWRLCSAG